MIENNKSIALFSSAKIDKHRVDQDTIQIWTWLNQPSYSKNTKSLYKSIIIQFFKFHWNVGIKEITTAHVTLFLKNLGEVSNSTKNLNRSCLASFYTFITKNGYVTENPVLPIKSKKIQPHIDGKIIPAESIKRMFELANSERNRLILEILYYLALRESELVSIQPNQFMDIEDGRAKLTIKGKGGRIRTIHVPRFLNNKIKKYISDHTIQVNEYLFSELDKNRSKPISRQSIFKLVKNIAKQAKIQPIPSPHWFRHSSSRHALNNGANIFEISKTLGHTSLSTTQIYLGNITEKSNGDYL